MNKQQTINVSAVIAGVALILSVAGYSIKTTINEMLLKQKVESLEDQRAVLRDNLRICNELANRNPTYEMLEIGPRHESSIIPGYRWGGIPPPDYSLPEESDLVEDEQQD